jgi:hypothetical protein
VSPGGWYPEREKRVGEGDKEGGSLKTETREDNQEARE